MANSTINTTIEILGKIYPVRCLESELPSLQQAADLLNQHMSEVKSSGKVINLERIAIISALNIAHQFLQLSQQKTNVINKINQRIVQLQDKLDDTINKTMQTEFVYSLKSAE